LKQPRVAVIMGSNSDMAVMDEACDILEEFSIDFTKHVISAHRSPDAVRKFAQSAERQGYQVIIAGAGMAAHLAGALAAHTVLPVVGVPLAGSNLGGLDSLLSTVQMPAGIPVATVAIGKPGARNAALLAIEILALSDKRLVRRLRAYRESLAKSGG